MGRLDRHNRPKIFLCNSVYIIESQYMLSYIPSHIQKNILRSFKQG